MSIAVVDLLLRAVTIVVDNLMCDASLVVGILSTGMMIMWFVMSCDDVHLMNGLWHSQSNTINQLSLIVCADAVNGTMRGEVWVSSLPCME